VVVGGVGWLRMIPQDHQFMAVHGKAILVNRVSTWDDLLRSNAGTIGQLVVSW